MIGSKSDRYPASETLQHHVIYTSVIHADVIRGYDVGVIYDGGIYDAGILRIEVPRDPQLRRLW